jgi:4-amino-4-deoxy-L-arabinose transferase-like glycosyltransferase
MNYRLSFLTKIFKFKALILLLLIVAFGAMLRFYRLEELMTYLGDEGRDMLIVIDIVQGKHFPLLGPPTSIGELYLGPVYYYFIAPFAWIFQMSPVGPAVFVALLGTLTIILIYWVTTKIYGSTAGFFAAILYTVSPLTVKFSRSSWNPNPMPFFSLLLILALISFFQTKKARFLYAGIITFGIMLQLHYIVILLIPFLGYLTFSLRQRLKTKKSLIIALLIFIVFMSPLLIFDLRHNFYNTRGILTIFLFRSKQGFNLIDIFSRSRDRLRQLNSLLFNFSERDWWTNLTSISLIVYIIYDWFNKKGFNRKVIYGWFTWGILAMGLYRQSVYPHYLGFMYPFPIIIFSGLTGSIFNRIKFGKIAAILLLVLFSWNMFVSSRQELTRPQVLNTFMVQKIVKLISMASNNQPFNFALLSNNNYDDSYRYYFRLWEMPASYKTEVTKQLFVVCEDEEVCYPQGNPKWEIAMFDAAYKGNIQIAGEWIPDPLIKVFKFVPSLSY